MNNTTNQSSNQSSSQSKTQRIFITNDQGITEAQAVVIMNQDRDETLKYITTANVTVNRTSVNGIVRSSSRSVARAIAP
jgi:hypothetical protein